MDQDKKNSKERRVGPPSVRNVLSGSGAGGITLWGGYLAFSEEMSQNLEGVHMGFLRQIMGQKEKRQREGTWISKALAKVLK